MAVLALVRDATNPPLDLEQHPAHSSFPSQYHLTQTSPTVRKYDPLVRSATNPKTASNSASPTMRSSSTPEQLALLPHNNAGPKLLASVWVLWALAASFTFLRMFCKLTTQRRLWWDDYVLAVAWIRYAYSRRTISQSVYK